MKFTHAFLALLTVAAANAQGLPNVPNCSLQCFLNALQGDGCAGLTDFACHCAKPDLVGKVTPCVKSACGPADQSSVSSLVESQCSAVGKPITVPPVGGGAPAPSPTGPPTTGPPAVPTTGPPPPSESSQTQAPVPPTSVPTPGIPSSPSSTRVPSSLIPSPSSSKPASTSPPSYAPAPPVFTGAAAHQSKNFAGAVAAALAACIF